MKSKTKWISAAILAIVLLISIFLYIQSRPPKEVPMGAGSAFPDEIRFEAKKANITDSVQVKGKSSYTKETILYAPFTAEVDKWQVAEGQSVEAGDLIFELDAENNRKELALSEARILQQQLDIKLLDAKAASGAETTAEQPALARFAQKEEDELQKKLKTIELELAREEVADLKQRLNQQRFFAPESGIFLFADQKEPKKVEQDQPIGKIVDLSELQLVCEVSEFEVFRIREGMEVEVRIDALQNEKIKGVVQKVAKFAKTPAVSGNQSGSAQFEIRISLERHPKLIAGLSLTGKIITEERQNATVIPTIAVMRDEDRYYVYVQGANGIEERTIRIGLETADQTEVLDGLSEGEFVVLR